MFGAVKINSTKKSKKIKKLVFMSAFTILFSAPFFVGAQEVEEPGFGEPTLRKMYCNSQKTYYACKYLSEGEDCPLSGTTTCY